MHFHFFKQEISSPDIPDENNPSLHYHQFDNSRTSLANNNDLTHTHIHNNIISSPPLAPDEIKALETGKGFKVTIGGEKSKVTRNLTEKQMIKEFKKLGLLSDMDVEISDQLGVGILESFNSKNNI